MESLKKNKLTITNLRKVYDDDPNFIALNDVSFEVKDGEFLSILGPSGCGKTTLLRIIVGLLPPTSGTVLLDDTDITHAPASARNMGIVFQNYALFENMTVKENICYAAILNAKRKIKEAKKQGKEYNADYKEKISAKAEELMANLGISEHANKRPGELSGGQQQRVAIARTLILHPQVMLFDEPMSALDVATRLQLRKIIKDIQKKYGTTMIYITHDQEEAFAMSDRILVMENSRISQIDTPENIISAPANDYVKQFVVDNLQTKIESLSRFMESGNE